MTMDANRRVDDAELERLAAAADILDVAMFAESLDGVITAWSRGADRLYGYSAAEAVGRPCALIVPPDRLDEHATWRVRAAKGERTDPIATTHLRKGGAPVHVSLKLVPIRNGAGVIAGMSTTARDITDQIDVASERNGLLDRERAAREDADRANNAKDAFLAFVAHELRSPLNAMAMWVHLVRTAGLTAIELERALDTIERNIRAQDRLIDELVDFSKIISGTLPLERRTVAPVDLIEGELEALRPSAEVRRVRVTSVLDAQAGPLVADPARLRQIVAGLVSSAIDSTPDGGEVTVTLQFVGSHAVIAIGGSGVGIAHELSGAVFDGFGRAGGAGLGPNRRLGLRLTIVRSLVELHGGTVVATSLGTGLGSTVTVNLPLDGNAAQRHRLRD